MSVNDAEAILSDDAGHFPYKYDDAVAAGISEERASAARDVVNAHQDYLLDPSEENNTKLTEAMVAAQAIAHKERAGTAPGGGDFIQPESVNGSVAANGESA